MLDFIRFAIAILPLAAYTNVLGLIRLRKSPTVLSGAMDMVLLGLAVMGFVAIGPIELFFPRAAYSLLGVWVWGVLITLYFFILMLVALNTPARLVVYGLDAASLKEHVCETLAQNGIRSEWLENMVDVPELGLRACIETAGRHCVSQIHSAGQQQNLPGWFTLERLLVQKLKSTSINQRHHAVVWLTISFALFGLAAFMISNDLPRLQQAMSSMFDRD